MRKRLTQSVLITCLAALISIPAAAQNDSSANDSGEKAQPNGQAKNIKTDNLSNSTSQKHEPPPARKGGPAAKGGLLCNIHVNNLTPLILSIYMNGGLVGVVGPWGDLYPNVTWGSAQLYGRAVFDDESALSFGPRVYQCAGGDFTWTLTP